MSLFEEVTPMVIVNAVDGDSTSSAADIAAERYINTEFFKYVTFWVVMGTVAAGEHCAVYKATNKSGSSATAVSAPFLGNVYYTNAASVSACTYVRTSATSSNTINVGTTSYACYYATVDCAKVTSASKTYIALMPHGNSMTNADFQVLAFGHGRRYQNETGVNAYA